MYRVMYVIHIVIVVVVHVDDADVMCSSDAGDDDHVSWCWWWWWYNGFYLSNDDRTYRMRSESRNKTSVHVMPMVVGWYVYLCHYTRQLLMLRLTEMYFTDNMRWILTNRPFILTDDRGHTSKRMECGACVSVGLAFSIIASVRLQICTFLCAFILPSTNRKSPDEMAPNVWI